MESKIMEQSIEDAYKKYLEHYKNNQWTGEDITYYLKKNWVDYEEYSFEEFIEKCKTEQKFNKKWGII